MVKQACDAGTFSALERNYKSGVSKTELIDARRSVGTCSYCGDLIMQSADVPGAQASVLLAQVQASIVLVAVEASRVLDVQRCAHSELMARRTDVAAINRRATELGCGAELPALDFALFQRGRPRPLRNSSKLLAGRSATTVLTKSRPSVTGAGEVTPCPYRTQFERQLYLTFNKSVRR